MTKLIAFVCAAFLMGAVATADAGIKIVKLQENGGTNSFTLADGASDTTKFYPVTDMAWHTDGDGDADGDVMAYIAYTFTAASTDSFLVAVDYYVGGVKFGTSTGALTAATSAALNVLRIDNALGIDGIPEAIRVRASNTDETGSASATGVQLWLVYEAD